MAEPDRALSEATIARIYRLMEQRRLNQAELARRSGLDRSTLSRLFNRERGTQVQTIERIALALGVPVTELLYPSPTHPAVLPQPPVPVPVVAQANAGRGAGHVEEWMYVPYDDAQGRDLRAFRVSGDCMAPEIEEGDAVIVDTQAAPQDGLIVAALTTDGAELLIKRYYRANGQIELRPNQGESHWLAEHQVEILGVAFQVNRRLQRNRKRK